MSAPPAWMEKPLSWVGLHWPDGDPDRLRAMSDEWLKLASAVRDHWWYADTSVDEVGRYNGGDMIDSMRHWWNTGPTENLGRAGMSAENIAAALRAMATQISILKAAFVVELGALAAAAAAAIYFSGGLAAVGTTIAAKNTQKALTKLILLAVGLATVGFIYWRLQESTLEKAEPKVIPEGFPSPDPEPTPTPVLRPRPIPYDWDISNEERQRCSVPPGMVVAPHLVNPKNLHWVDGRTAGGGILRIVADEYGRQRLVTIDSVIKDPLGKRFDFESHIRGRRRLIGLPDDTYDAAHLVGPNLGNEAADGILLASWEVNRQFHKRAEGWLQSLHEGASRDGGWVELRSQSMSHHPEAWKSPHDGRLGGHYVLANSWYEATVCRPNSQGVGVPIETYRFGVNVGRPGSNGEPGRISLQGPIGPLPSN